jgi:glucose dehydrogenase
MAGYQSGVWWHIINGFFFLFTAVAIWMKKSWSQYLVHFIALLFIGSWIWAVWQVWRQGWPYESFLQTLISLLPGLLMVGVALGSMIVVHKDFRRRNQ